MKITTASQCKASQYKIEECYIPSIRGSGKMEFFVDTVCGKNLRVFDTRHEAERFIETIVKEGER